MVTRDRFNVAPVWFPADSAIAVAIVMSVTLGPLAQWEVWRYLKYPLLLGTFTPFKNLHRVLFSLCGPEIWQKTIAWQLLAAVGTVRGRVVRRPAVRCLPTAAGAAIAGRAATHGAVVPARDGRRSTARRRTRTAGAAAALARAGRVRFGAAQQVPGCHKQRRRPTWSQSRPVAHRPSSHGYITISTSESSENQ